MTEKVKVLEAKLEEAEKDNKRIDKKVEALNVMASAIHHYRSASYEKNESTDDQRRYCFYNLFQDFSGIQLSTELD